MNSSGSLGLNSPSPTNVGVTNNDMYNLNFITFAASLQSKIVDIAVGGGHSCAMVNPTGSRTRMICWGQNDQGQTGNIINNINFFFIIF